MLRYTKQFRKTDAMLSIMPSYKGYLLNEIWDEAEEFYKGTASKKAFPWKNGYIAMYKKKKHVLVAPHRYAHIPVIEVCYCKKVDDLVDVDKQDIWGMVDLTEVDFTSPKLVIQEGDSE